MINKNVIVNHLTFLKSLADPNVLKTLHLKRPGVDIQIVWNRSLFCSKCAKEQNSNNKFYSRDKRFIMMHDYGVARTVLTCYERGEFAIAVESE